MTQKAAAVLYAQDISKVGQFYVKIAKLVIVHSEKDYLILESKSFQLVVVAAPKKFTPSINISTVIRRENSAVKIVFYIPDIAAARVAATRLGGAINPVEREWDFLDCKVCDGHDPEGNVIQLREHQRQKPPSARA